VEWGGLNGIPFGGQCKGFEFIKGVREQCCEKSQCQEKEPGKGDMPKGGKIIIIRLIREGGVGRSLAGAGSACQEASKNLTESEMKRKKTKDGKESAKNRLDKILNLVFIEKGETRATSAPMRVRVKCCGGGATGKSRPGEGGGTNCLKETGTKGKVGMSIHNKTED